MRKKNEEKLLPFGVTIVPHAIRINAHIMTDTRAPNGGERNRE